MARRDRDETGTNPDRRQALECMVWAGTGVVWTVSGGVPCSLGLLGSKPAMAADSSFSFVQISDSHIGFEKPANPNARATLSAAIDKVKVLPVKPAFMLHTGDITHLSKPVEFDDATQLIGAADLDVHYVPGEHDVIDEARGEAYVDRYGKAAKDPGYYAFDHGGVRFIGLVNVVNLQAGGLGQLGGEQLAWLADNLAGLSASTPIVVFAHIPLWSVYPAWGWGTQDSEQALALLQRFGSVTVLNGHIHQLMQKVEGNVTFHTAYSTAFPQPQPGSAPSPGPQVVPAEKLHSVLGIRTVLFKTTNEPLALTDTPLSAT